VKELRCRHGFSEASHYLWRSKYGGMDSSLKFLTVSKEADAMAMRLPYGA
jgi:putative transposase